MIHIRPPYQASHQPESELPREILWLRFATRGLMALLVIILLTAVMRSLLQAPWLSMTRITVSGDTHFHNNLTLRANVLPALTGNFLSLDLRLAQQRFEALPWIRSAVVQRTFPSTLAVTLTAHVPVARWGEQASDTGVLRLVNAQGEIFEAIDGQIETDELPLLIGADATAAEILTLFQQLQSSLNIALTKHSMTALVQSPQGLWRAKLSNGVWLELGSGSKQVVIRRVDRWLKAIPVVIEKYNAHALQSIDFRYADGFAIRLDGVTTQQEK